MPCVVCSVQPDGVARTDETRTSGERDRGIHGPRPELPRCVLPLGPPRAQCNPGCGRESPQIADKECSCPPAHESGGWGPGMPRRTTRARRPTDARRTSAGSKDMRVSVSSCLTMRNLPAPTARRTAISLCRVIPHAVESQAEDDPQVLKGLKRAISLVSK